MSDEKKKVPRGEGAGKEKVLEDVKAFLSADEQDSGEDLLLSDGGLREMDELMKRGKPGVSLVLFLIGLAIIIGIVGFVVLNEKAQEKFIGFVRGDLYEVQRKKAETLQKQYQDRMELLNERYGDIKLNYFPRDSKVYIIQQAFKYDGVDDKESEKWGDPLSIDNATLHLAAGEELPELSIENLPIREKGMLCPDDKQFYPASRGYCPEWQAKCMAQEAESEECTKHALKLVQHCSQDDTYYESLGAGVMVCPDGETAMDPAKLPIYVFHYSFLFEREDYVGQLVSYSDNDWRDLGFGKYIIQFPAHFALIPDWPPLQRRYEDARRKMRCWRVEWEDQWEAIKRHKVLATYETTKKTMLADEEAREKLYRSVQAPYLRDMPAVDAVRKVATMATIKNGMAEIFYYCGELGKCDATKMEEFRTLVLGSKKSDMSDLGDVEKGIYFGVLKAMGVKRWDGMDAFLASHPEMGAGLTCLEKWVPIQKEGEFKPVKDKECEQALQSIQGTAPNAAMVFRSMFLEEGLGKNRLVEYETDVNNYLLAENEYQGSQKYQEMVDSMEKTGRFLEYLILAYLFDPTVMNQALAKYAESRVVNYRLDCEARKIIPSDYSVGFKKAMEMAWWTGSKLAFDEWYFRLWREDVQGCLLFAKKYDPPRYDKGMATFQSMLGDETEGLRKQVAAFREYRRSLVRFEELLPELKEARRLYRENRSEFSARYPEETIKTWEMADPDRYWGFLYIINETKAKSNFAEVLKLPAPEYGQPDPKEGDQAMIHRYLAYQFVFDTAKYEAGLKVLEDRVAPMLMTPEEYATWSETNPGAPELRRALQDIVNKDIHLKYFWLLRLTDNSKFLREFNRLDLKEARLVSKWIDPQRYAYLVDLAWLQETPVALYDRYSQTVPALQDSLEVDLGLYEIEYQKLKDWASTRAQVLKKYKMKRTGESFKGEPTNVLKALEKSLKMGNRVALLAQNIEDFGEAEVTTLMGRAMDELRDEIDGGQRDSYAKHVDGNNDRMRLNSGFKKKEWESLTEKFEKTAANADWYAWLTGTLANKRQDCRKIDYPKPDDWAELIESEMGN